MNIDFITDPEMAPRPRDEIKIESLSVEAYPDQQKFRIETSITPFGPADRPNLEIVAVDEEKQPLGSLSIIETIHRRLSLTMHIKNPIDPHVSKITFIVMLYYEPEDIQHTSSTVVRLTEK